jgi:1-acyl-sn-glycerol-3-phosphate acyltransferase
MLIARSFVFNAAGLVWTVVTVLLFMPCLLRPAACVWAGRTWMTGVQFLLRHVIGLDYEVRGRANILAGTAIYAFKHQSTWETTVTQVVLRNSAVALKQELTRFPVFGWYLTRGRMIAIDRAGGTRAMRSLIKGARAAVARGDSVIIFPEGHRIPPGRHVPYQPGVAALHKQLTLPVVPVAHNSGMFWARRSFVKRPGRIVLEFLEPIEPGLDRATFMAELHQRLEGACDRLIEEAGGLEPKA